MTGEIPAALGSLPSITSILLDENNLSGALPTELGTLTTLLALKLEGIANSPADPRRPASSGELLATVYGENRVVCATGCRLSDLVDDDRVLRRDLSLDREDDHRRGGLLDAAVRNRTVGGTDAVMTEIDMWVAATNKAFTDSEANQELSLVASEEVNYAETYAMSSDLARLVRPSDGHLDEIHDIRDRIAADIVILVVDHNAYPEPSSQPCGIAYPMDKFWPGSERRAFALVSEDCGALTFAHEAGHLMGLFHDRYVECSGGTCAQIPYVYSYGYVNQQALEPPAPPVTARWRTVMAFQSQCRAAGFSCRQLFRFSNPNQTYQGDSLGVAGLEKTADVDGPADAVRALNNTRETVANFRQAPAITVSFGAAAYTATEGGTAATVTGATERGTYAPHSYSAHVNGRPRHHARRLFRTAERGLYRRRD